jgi:hypothetical protein
VTARIRQWTLDVHDVDLMARFWSATLGYRVDMGDDGNAKLYPPDTDPDGEDTDPFVVLADPEGNEFCLLRNPTRRPVS